MIRYLKLYLVSLAAFLAIDLLWLGLVALMNFTRRDIAYTAVILQAPAGNSVKHAAIPAVALPAWITFGLVRLTLVAAFFLRRAEKVVR